MPLFDWIHSNLHDLNLDWIINKIKNVETAEANSAASAADANAAKVAAAGSATAANNSKTAAAGSATAAAASAQTAQNLVDQLDTTIAADVVDWLNTHVTPTSPIVDDTLTIQGAAADAKKTGDEITDLKTDLNNYQYTGNDSEILLTEGKENGYFNGTSIAQSATYTHIEIDNPLSKGVRYVMLYLAQVTTLGTVWLIKNGQAYQNNGSANKWVMIDVTEDTEKIYINFWDDTYAVNAKLICNSPSGIGIVESIIKSLGRYYNPSIKWFANTIWRFTDGAQITNTNYACTQKIKNSHLPAVSFVSGTGLDTYINVWLNGTTAGYYLVRTGVWRSPSGTTITEPTFDEYAVCYNGQDTENCILTYPSVEDIKTSDYKMVVLPDIEKQNATLDNVKQISVIGDSIAHGANCPVMYEDAWASIMRGFLQYQYSNKNYGYAHLLSYIANQDTYREIHTVALGDGWNGTNYDSRSIGGYSISNVSSASDVTITTRKPQKKFRLIYSTGTGYGSFEVLVNGTSKGTVNTAGSAGNYNLTPVYEGDENNNFTITIHKLDSNPVVLNGIYYFDDWNASMLNNYAYSGIKLTDIPNDVLTQCCDADMVFFSLGTNGYSTQADYTAKIDHIISQFANDSVINNRLLIVMNFLWQTPEADSFIKRENRRLANSVPHSVYIDFNKVLGNLTTEELQTIGFLNYDSAHPTPAGHKFIAEYTATVLNLICRLKSMIGKY